ncbi:hypothetical protein OAC38_02185, partial [Candidatus Poseidoniaceae archaeon]|nr:hypothetical protein [Candidatus Poseidoniaceae archaeon]
MAFPFWSKFKRPKKRVTLKNSNITGELNFGDDFQEGSNLELKLNTSNIYGGVTINHIHGLDKFEKKIEDIVEKVMSKTTFQQSQLMYDQLTHVKNSVKMDSNVVNKLLSLHKIASILEKSGYIGDGKKVRIDLAKMKIETDSPALQIEGYQQLCVFDPDCDWFNSLRTALVLVHHHDIHKSEFHVKSQILHYISEGRSTTNQTEMVYFAKKLIIEASNLPRKMLKENPSARRFYKSATDLCYNKTINLSKDERKKLLEYDFHRARRKDMKQGVKGLILLLSFWAIMITLVLLFLNWLGSVVLGFLG